jgi:DnaK suppressor protein
MASTSTTATNLSPWTELRDRLERERAELITHLETMFDERPEATATTGQGETEHVSNEVAHDVQALLNAGGAARLGEVDDALRRLDDGTYGACERCGSAIGVARLEILPHARLCLTCQTDEDARRRRRPAR